MKIYRFDADVGRTIDIFNSEKFIISKIVQLKAEIRVSCFHLGPNGKVGYHQAVTPQLFLVMLGEGWVRNETSAYIPVLTGQAIFWDKGEWHEAGTDTGLMAIVIEGESLNPSESMPLA